MKSRNSHVMSTSVLVVQSMREHYTRTRGMRCLLKGCSLLRSTLGNDRVHERVVCPLREYPSNTMAFKTHSILKDICFETTVPLTNLLRKWRGSSTPSVTPSTYLASLCVSLTFVSLYISSASSVSSLYPLPHGGILTWHPTLPVLSYPHLSLPFSKLSVPSDESVPFE